MTGELLAGLFYLGAIAFGLLVGELRLKYYRRVTSRQIVRLHDALRLRQLYAEARRFEFATLLRIWATRPMLTAPETLEDFGEELLRQSRTIGLNFDGTAAPGFPHPRSLAPAEYAELASLSGLQI